MLPSPLLCQPKRDLFLYGILEVLKVRKLFCEISPATYRISVLKEQLLRRLQDGVHRVPFAEKRCQDPLPVLVYQHKSLIRRRLGNVDQQLQENKAVNLSIAAPKIHGLLIEPGEVFSFWHLVGSITAKKGYRTGLVIRGGRADADLGGGMCQFTNLIHWMVLHSPLTITEHHHHNGLDLFPDFGRQIPFGTGTSIMYNYLDYRVQNNTDQTFQLLVWTEAEYLCGELRCQTPLPNSYHVVLAEEYFTREGETYYRNNTVYRDVIDKETGRRLQHRLLIQNHAKVAYEAAFIPADKLRLEE